MRQSDQPGAAVDPRPGRETPAAHSCCRQMFDGNMLREGGRRGLWP